MNKDNSKTKLFGIIKPHKKKYEGDCRNVYEELGMKANELDNPYDLVHPSVSAIVARTGGGKTNLIPTLNERLGYCDRIVLFSGTPPEKECVYRFIDEKMNADGEKRFEAYHGFDRFEQVVRELESDPDLRDEKIMLIIDDFIGNNKKTLDKLASFAMRSRKTTNAGLSYIIIAQSYYNVPKLMREQCSYVFLGRGFDRRELRSICSRFSCNDLSIDQIYDMYKRATKTNKITDWFTIDMCTFFNNLKFRKQFTSCFMIDKNAGMDFNPKKDVSDIDDEED